MHTYLKMKYTITWEW